ncbi:hypothetical protein Halru_0569 [Halovivax ruber XH-70]|uniref:Uncharacterized protein n=1 Tax=Halovivax ruber (strain DSM 18193 / JCM 13892 / XH-70) TaxID=797302 RepID=L0IB71_HALRX|nr:DUF5807 family protein [Halovivax ruber]AGB15202.1 hypothetical protein Halru_0569 [Halovivax ruber XH-70]
MPTDREAFLAGDRPDDVAIYIEDDAIDDETKLEDYGDRVADGTLLVVEGEQGRNAFRAATGLDAMAFAKEAMGTEGEIAETLTDATCPEHGDGNDDDDTHDLKFIFAFSEEQNEDVGGLYAEGDVVHAYARCTCGEAYSDKWVVEE